ncbi:hypothetical protein HHI36_012410 [Cryptolaemus montrouzieri]|uniref:Uncharacterized protein n=1 Tax=Cryptolaemus montrouzieri TaxID=559131 RepID=A0ABD2NEM3_9CUCU
MELHTSKVIKLTSTPLHTLRYVNDIRSQDAKNPKQARLALIDEKASPLETKKLRALGEHNRKLRRRIAIRAKGGSRITQMPNCLQKVISTTRTKALDGGNVLSDIVHVASIKKELCNPLLSDERKRKRKLLLIMIMHKHFEIYLHLLKMLKHISVDL